MCSAPPLVSLSPAHENSAAHLLICLYLLGDYVVHVEQVTVWSYCKQQHLCPVVLLLTGFAVQNHIPTNV